MVQLMEETKNRNELARQTLEDWQANLKNNPYIQDADFIHSINFYFSADADRLHAELKKFGQSVVEELEALVAENNLASNLPRLDSYDAMGEFKNSVMHHPSYVAAGNVIYRSNLLGRLAQPGGLLEALCFLFLSSQTGEAGHNCPIACSAGIIRVLQHIPDFPQKAFFLQKLTTPSFSENYTGAQFLTEIQGGSDVGLNAAYAKQDENQQWRIYGEKWFCSNANADLIFITARYDQNKSGTKGLALFLVPAKWQDKVNHYSIRRLKDKIGTRSMATGEIDFTGAYAIQIGSLENGFSLAMHHVLHLSRLFNAFCVLGMARRAYTIACTYAQYRIAFGTPIINYPLVQNNLAKMKAENTALLAGMFATVRLQDEYDMGLQVDKSIPYLLRLLANMQKYQTALWSVEHIHHALDVLAGNGTIETFSSIPRLLRDVIVCENWEGTHNVLCMQIYKDILKYDVDRVFLDHLRDMLKKVQNQSVFESALDRLERQMLSFRGQDSKLQSLQIRELVNAMASVYNALMLLLEAENQLNANQTSTKLDCFHLFALWHLQEDKPIFNNDYLVLIEKIVSSC